MLREFEKCCHDRIAIGPLSDNPQLLPSPVLSSSQPALVLQPVGPCYLDRLPMCSGQAGTASTWKKWMISASSLWNIICILRMVCSKGMLKGCFGMARLASPYWRKCSWDASASEQDEAEMLVTANTVAMGMDVGPWIWFLWFLYPHGKQSQDNVRTLLLKSTPTLFLVCLHKIMFSQYFLSYTNSPHYIYEEQLSSPPLAFMLLDLLSILWVAQLKVG